MFFFVDGPGGTDKTYLYKALLAKLTGRLSSPESSQHSRSQARIKEEGCVRFWQTSIKIATLMDLKPTRNSLGA